MPQFNAPSWYKPPEYEAIGNLGNSLDSIFNSYQRAKQGGQQQLTQNAQLATQGIDAGALQADPMAETKRLLQAHMEKRQREGQMQEVDMRLKESEIYKNMNPDGGVGGADRKSVV